MTIIRVGPDRENIEVTLYRGDDMIPFEVVYPLDAAYLPATSANWSARAQIRLTTEAIDILASMVVTIYAEGDTIVFQMNLSDTLIEAFTFTKARWDLEVIFPTGYKKTLASGEVLLDKDVTK